MFKLTSLLTILFVCLGLLYIQNSFHPLSSSSPTQPTTQLAPSRTITPLPTAVTQPPTSYIIPQKLQVYQTFNNCGPATLSMLLSYYNVNIDQQTLGRRLRPYQNPAGDNDDKSVTMEEYFPVLDENNLIYYKRAHGSINLLKQLLSHNIPVVVRTWLHPNEDIGHFRIVRGYDDTTDQIIQDDSYQGSSLKFSYNQFLNIWQPFNYQFLIVARADQKAEVESILQSDLDPVQNYKLALQQAEQESSQDPQNPYPVFNQVTSLYYLGDYQKSIDLYESVKPRLPGRMLWYQYEPILAYQKLKMDDQAIREIDNILDNHNRAFSELYQIKGEIYLDEGHKDLAKSEFEKAVFYNQNYAPAKQSLAQLN